jgi:hypothetical protein
MYSSQSVPSGTCRETHVGPSSVMPPREPRNIAGTP